MRGAVARLVVAAGLAMSAAGPALATPQSLELRPGSGIVKRDRPPRRRKDAARQAAAQVKRERKNARRRRDAWTCYAHNDCLRPYSREKQPFAKGVTHG